MRLALVVRTLWDQRTGPLFLQLEHHFDTPDLWDAAIAEHQAVLAAIEAHDGAKARATMRRHMDEAARRFQKSWTRGSASATKDESEAAMAQPEPPRPTALGEPKSMF